MLDVSERPFEGSVSFVNDGFGNRCLIDGAYFDAGGICNFGHERGRVYYQAKEKKPAPKPRTISKTVERVCEVFSGCRCTICGGFFADGDDICANGHMICQKY